MPSTTVLLAGATGMLGGRVARHLLDAEDVALRLLVRPAAPADPTKRAQLDALAKHGAGRRYERRGRGTTTDLRAWIGAQREGGEATAGMYGTYQLYMLTGQTVLDDLQNDRYPDIEPVTLAQLLEVMAA